MKWDTTKLLLLLLLFALNGTKNFGVEVFIEIQNVVLEENGEDKMVRESN